MKHNSRTKLSSTKIKQKDINDRERIKFVNVKMLSKSLRIPVKKTIKIEVSSPQQSHKCNMSCISNPIISFQTKILEHNICST